MKKETFNGIIGLILLVVLVFAMHFSLAGFIIAGCIFWTDWELDRVTQAHAKNINDLNKDKNDLEKRIEKLEKMRE